MIVAIVGSRTGFDEAYVHKKLAYHLPIGDKHLHIFSGGAPGVDTYAESFARKNNIDIQIIRPINPRNKFSYLLRNVELLTKADIVIAFWDGKSRGTKFVIDYCNARKKDIIVYS